MEVPTLLVLERPINLDLSLPGQHHYCCLFSVAVKKPMYTQIVRYFTQYLLYLTVKLSLSLQLLFPADHF